MRLTYTNNGNLFNAVGLSHGGRGNLSERREGSDEVKSGMIRLIGVGKVKRDGVLGCEGT